MRSLQDQLLRSGLVSTKEASKRNAELQLNAEEVEQRNHQSRTVDMDQLHVDLTAAKSIGDFKRIAKTILEIDPRQIGVVVRAGHTLAESNYEGRDDYPPKKLRWFVLELRQRLSQVPAIRHKELLKRAFRRHNPTFDLPE